MFCSFTQKSEIKYLFYQKNYLCYSLSPELISKLKLLLKSNCQRPRMRYSNNFSCHSFVFLFFSFVRLLFFYNAVLFLIWTARELAACWALSFIFFASFLFDFWSLFLFCLSKWKYTKNPWNKDEMMERSVVVNLWSG